MMNFRKLHTQENPLVICNVWDVWSAQRVEKSEFQAIGTSSAALAKVLGYEDGEKMSFDELEYMVKRISACCQLPLSVDLESGYSRQPLTIVEHIKRLVDLGVVGVNLEDSIVEKERHFLDPDQFAQTLSIVKNQLEKDQVDIFLNIRTDAFLLAQPQAVDITKKRIEAYENAGADGFFIPCIVADADIKAIVDHTDLPINVMCMPSLPDFGRLKTLGVKRISMGNFLFDHMYQHFESMLHKIVQQESFQSVFSVNGKR